MKKIAALMIAAITTVTVGISALAAAPTVYLNGEQITFDVEPFIENDRTLVPMRAIFEAYGAKIIWDQSTLTVNGIKETDDSVDVVTLQINNTTAFINGTETVIDVPAKVVEDRTFVPLRFVSEALNAYVDWDQENLRVDITTAN